ncbi:fibrinogen alpha chain [Mixophyes fleayi]|uniref:fibrinogen alpha chain n=1 Tax=Mixophyes fleayi TaxID=3061075 RepID=UPI003F4DB0C6
MIDIRLVARLKRDDWLQSPHNNLHSAKAKKMLRATLVTLLLCLVSTAWSSESTFIEDGGAGRGPRILEAKAAPGCKQEKNWPICSDDDWGPKCPSGCRIQGLADQSDKDFAKRIDTIKKQLNDGDIKFKSVETRTKETYELIKGNLVAAQQTDGTYNLVTENLRRKIDFLKITVSSQIERIKLLQRNVKDQVSEMKRVEVDIDIKLRACKGSCSKGVDYNVDHESYENIKKQIVQLDSTDLRPNSNALPVLKMRPIKESTVDSRYKTLAQQKDQYPIFTDIEQYSFVLEGKSKQVTGQAGSSSSTTYVSGTEKEQPTKTKFVVIEDKSTQPGKTVSGGDKTIVTSESHVISCTKTIHKKIVHGPSGPREEITETISGGEECQRLEKLKADGKAKLDSDGTYTLRVTGSGSLGEANIGTWEDFLSGKAVSGGGGGSAASSSGTKITHTASFTPGEDEFDDFSHTDLGAPSFIPVKTQGSSGSTTYTKTVYSSDGNTKEASQWNTKYKSGPVFEDVGPIQHLNSEEDVPDFSARSVQTGVKVSGAYRGQDCADILQKHSSGAKSGIFKISPEGSLKELSVYCDQDTQLGGWLLIQQREDGSLNFNRTWQDYKNGFGSVDANGKGELWLGNEYIHLLSKKETVLRIELEDWSGKQVYAEYGFNIGSESEGYALNVQSYDGSAGDALIEGSKDDREYTSHVNMKFSTHDRDSDKWEENCAEMYGGGWWYNNCQAANLNGIYYTGGQYDPRNNAPYEIENGIVWVSFKPVDYSLKTVKMKIRPVDTE